MKNLGWFALGAAVGATAAVLLAPDKGEHTRRRIAEGIEQHDLLAKSRELYAEGRKIAQEAADMFEHGRTMAEADFDEHLVSEQGI